MSPSPGHMSSPSSLSYSLSRCFLRDLNEGRRVNVSSDVLSGSDARRDGRPVGFACPNDNLNPAFPSARAGVDAEDKDDRMLDVSLVNAGVAISSLLPDDPGLECVIDAKTESLDHL